MGSNFCVKFALRFPVLAIAGCGRPLDNAGEWVGVARCSELWRVAREAREDVFFVDHQKIKDKFEEIAVFSSFFVFVHGYYPDEVVSLRE